ncbi:MAG: X-Pro aminopeptidase [Puniceicoccaceae bacterium]|nr:X-Pro aminopeptidase [Puniceicoccaceae bacterium]|tara:strand:+ start:998 stop:2284 length:1287 start_codon:yes stop_codon:yes gene_type:complete
MRHRSIQSKLFLRNRKNLGRLLSEKGLAISNANDVLPSNADGTLPFHPNSDLFYLSGIEQEESRLVLFPGCSNPKHREILFLREPNENLKIWEGYKHSKEDARKISGIPTVYWIQDFDHIFQLLAAEADIFYLNSNEHNRADNLVETRDQRLNQEIQKKYPLHRIERLAPYLHDLRFCKSAEEIKLIKQAIEVTSQGFHQVLRMVKPGVKEYEIEAEWAREFIRRRSKFAYTPIVASGANACVLHYLQNDQACKKGDLLLMDVGACYANYNADLSRTIPVSGKFTRRQKQVYNAVLRVLRQSINNATIGKSLKQWQNDSHDMMTEEMLRLKLITPSQIKKQDPENPACRKFFMHGLGHSLGLDVHDVSNGQSEFRENSIFTVEPGIYLPDEGFGIRLEDNIQITKVGPRNLMANIPIEIEEIEQIMNH